MKFPKVVGYELVQEIGGGGFSTVYRAAHIEQHRVAACKVIQLTPNTTEKERKTIEKEMRIHAALKHRNVLEFLNAVVVEPGHARYVSAFYILLEFAAGGDLFDKIVPDVGINEEVAQYYFNQLLNGMSYIHSQGVCHRDLKPENILLDVAGTLKISDFGLSAVYMLKESGKTRPLSERCGSLPYVAPELARDVPYQAQPVDAWGIGVMLFTMLSGNTPWDEPTAQSVEFRAYISGEIFDVNPWKKLSEDALSLICGLLTYNPEERMTLSEAGQHPWCIRPSQLGSRGPLELANRLIENLKNAGDLEFANPSVDSDGDSSMSDGTDPNSVSASHSSQFTQSLLLFSQTQSGTRYTPHLTRFYSSSGPSVLLTIISRVLERMNVKFKAAPTGEDAEGQGQGPGPFKLRIGGYDRRRVMFKGWVVVERFAYREVGGSFCVMQRDVGDPISWRRLWRDLIEAEEIGPSVLRK